MAIQSQNIEDIDELNKVGGIARWRTTAGNVPPAADAPVWAEPDWNCLRVPENGIADLWKCDLEFEVERDFSLLSADEKDRADRFHFAVHRRRYIAAHGWLRRILGGYLRLDPREVAFARNDFGKPFLASAPGQEELGFNLSHSADCALIGVSRAAMIGVDVELVRLMNDAAAIVQRQFAPEEWTIYEATPEPGKPAMFFRLWTLKEAFVKARGKGLSESLRSFAVDPGDSGDRGARLTRIDRDPETVSCWKLTRFEVQPGYLGALAVSCDTLSSCRGREGRDESDGIDKVGRRRVATKGEWD